MVRSLGGAVVEIRGLDRTDCLEWLDSAEMYPEGRYTKEYTAEFNRWVKNRA